MPSVSLAHILTLRSLQPKNDRGNPHREISGVEARVKRESDITWIRLLPACQKALQKRCVLRQNLKGTYMLREAVSGIGDKWRNLGSLHHIFRQEDGGDSGGRSQTRTWQEVMEG